MSPVPCVECMHRYGRTHSVITWNAQLTKLLTGAHSIDGLLDKPPVCRHYEAQYAGILNFTALPNAAVQQLWQCKANLLDSVDHFFAAHDFCSVVDRGATLRFHMSAAKLSLFSARMKTAALSKYADAALPAVKRLLPFEGDLGDSHARHKCFLTQAMADAQVCCGRSAPIGTADLSPQTCASSCCCSQLQRLFWNKGHTAVLFSESVHSRP